MTFRLAPAQESSGLVALETLEVRPSKTIDRVHVPMALPVLVSAGAAVTAVLLYLTRRFDFFSDEWTFLVAAPSWGLKSFFEPHNEHWVTALMAWYQAVFLVFGARNYHVFMAGGLLLGVGGAWPLLFLLPQRSGGVPPPSAPPGLLLLGNGSGGTP